MQSGVWGKSTLEDICSFCVLIISFKTPISVQWRNIIRTELIINIYFIYYIRRKKKKKYLSSKNFFFQNRQRKVDFETTIHIKY